MLQSNIRELLPMMDAAGFVEVEGGMTKYRVLAFVRGTVRKVRS
jgi:hypothetical protein